MAIQELSTLFSTVGYNFIGFLLIVVGLLLTLAGKRFFKPFLLIIGFVLFACVGFISSTVFMETFMKEEVSPGTMYESAVILAVALGLVGACLCMTVWKIGIYGAAALGGYALGTYLLTLRLKIIEEYMVRQTFLILMSFGSVIMAIFFTELVVILASAFVGALFFVCGVDIFADTGLNGRLMSIVVSRRVTLSIDDKFSVMLAAVVVIALFGTILQLAFPPNRKHN